MQRGMEFGAKPQLLKRVRQTGTRERHHDAGPAFLSSTTDIRRQKDRWSDVDLVGIRVGRKFNGA
jgi:hypothetical protein